MDNLTVSLDNLPMDIERLIFEHLASLGDTSCALVSKEVQQWVEPILYEEVVLETDKAIEAFHRTVSTFASDLVTSNKRGDFFSASVKSLFIHVEALAYYQEELLPSIFHACPSIRSFSLISVMTSGLPKTLSFPQGLSPTYAMFQLRGLSWRSHVKTSPIFRNVTHLELRAISTELEWLQDMMASIEAPHLTHLALFHLPPPYDPQEIRNAPASAARLFLPLTPPSVKIFVLIITATLYILPGLIDELKEIGRGDVDPRAVPFVHCHGPGWSTLRLEGGEGIGLGIMAEASEVHKRHWHSLKTSAGKGYWTLAEEIIEKRNRNRAGDQAQLGLG